MDHGRQSTRPQFCDLWHISNIILILTKKSGCKIRKDLNKGAIETLLNKLFVLDDQEKNEATIRQYANENNIIVQQNFVAKIVNGFL